ncbi:MAG: GNAT family N-acetyltransferase, partial [Oscillospiraceae bacterium]|nr:GNAT family N-acetyltransferase [Oscillospiraceae bacterium]
MEIIQYNDRYKKQIIDLILHIQNNEAKIELALDEQPDLLNIPASYEKNGGRFFIAVENEEVIGTLAYMNYGNGNAVLKKFFVRADWRSKKVGLALYQVVLRQLKEDGYSLALLDTPSVAEKSHRFYEKAGFKRITSEELPFRYEYPDRD